MKYNFNENLPSHLIPKCASYARSKIYIIIENMVNKFIRK